LAEATQEAQNGLSRQRKGKKSKSSKLSEIGIITKSASQDFQQRKRLVKWSYGSKVISGQSLVKLGQKDKSQSDTWHHCKGDTWYNRVSNMTWQGWQKRGQVK